MKDSRNTAKLLDLPYAPEADALLDELEKSGQFRIGLDAEVDEESPDAPCAEYFWGRGSGNIAIDDWWTAGSVELRVGPGITPADIALIRINDSLVVRTTDNLDRVTIENYLGLTPDAATLRIVFNDGTELAGAPLLARITGWLAETPPAENPPAG